MDFTEWVGVVAGALTAVSLLPQLIKLVREKKAEDISMFFLILLICGLSLWTWYGFLRKDIPIIVTNAFSILINLTMIVLGIKYKRKV